ncbi:hypothetical protein TIFTF001_020638 [Ficus carica]|uniref:Uncharacterized protein n=1 Tax=Ficus carica TaxID=3494 RepID=A0AA88AG43_FICCA|nr:hypothetical protein TIFTF001_020638 [Ficus carica]
MRRQTLNNLGSWGLGRLDLGGAKKAVARDGRRDKNREGAAEGRARPKFVL